MQFLSRLNTSDLSLSALLPVHIDSNFSLRWRISTKRLSFLSGCRSSIRHKFATEKAIFFQSKPCSNESLDDFLGTSLGSENVFLFQVSFLNNVRRQLCILKYTVSVIRWYKLLNSSPVAYCINVCFPDCLHLLSGLFVDDEQSKHWIQGTLTPMNKH